ncbi:hypothetical protein BH11BAC3_BH11BAC3_32640 [soil metagenome]
MSVQFQSLFTIQVLHDYYNKHDNKCADFDIVPAPDCALLTKNMQVLHKNYNNKLLTVINADKEVNDTPPPDFRLTPFLNFSKELVFRWYMILKNPYFSNFTSIALNQGARKRLYFSNLSNNKVGSTLSLTDSILPFTTGKIYAPGNLVKGADGNFYEAIRTSDDTPESKDIANKDYWQMAAINNPYVSDVDEVTVTDSSYTYKLQTPASNINIKIFSANKADSNLPFNKLIETVDQAFSQEQEMISIDLSKKNPGKYKIVVNGEADTWVYVDANAVQQNVVGIIEIHHFDNVPTDFQLLTSGGHIKVPEPVFTIWFKNRAVTWKYISQNGDIGVTDDAVSPRIFLPGSGAIVKSAEAIALTETPVATLTATKTATGKEIRNLKNPEVEKLVFEQEGATGFYASNMYVKIDT